MTKNITLEKDGMLRLPKSLLTQMALKTGDNLLCYLENQTLCLTPEKNCDPASSPPHRRVPFTPPVLGRSASIAAKNL